jgi:hypothetical protein
MVSIVRFSGFDRGGWGTAFDVLPVNMVHEMVNGAAEVVLGGGWRVHNYETVPFIFSTNS